jgi:hypothetical protein
MGSIMHRWIAAPILAGALAARASGPGPNAPAAERRDHPDADSDRVPRPIELVLLGGSGSSTFAAAYGPHHDLVVEVRIDPPPAAGETRLVTEPTTIETLSNPLSNLHGTLGDRPVSVDVVALLHLRRLRAQGPYRRDLAPTTDWLLFGAGNAYFLAWMRIQVGDPVQVVAVTARDPLPERPLQVPLPVRPLRVGELFEIDLGGGVKRTLQVMAEAIPARGFPPAR